MSKSSIAVLGLAGAALLAIPGAALAQSDDAATQASSASTMDAAFARFAPAPGNDDRRIDYSAWDEAMDYIVLPMGRSLRQTPGSVDPGPGTRRIYGHSSRYRLEGNRVMFSFFTPELKQTVADYRRDLEQTADLVEIAKLQRNEQLAYWINLHNVAMIEQIANSWPVRQPQSIAIDGVPMDEAKFITVNGVAMSPRDIRTKIVYPNWRDPKVVYGFWRGDIGGPSLQRDAFNGENVGRLLERGGYEFVNSLRGTQKRGDLLQVSEIYEEARPFFFSDWPASIRSHVTQFAEEDVKELLAKTEAVEASIYEADIADLAGGVREPSYSNITTTGQDGIERSASFRIPQAIARLLRERDTKMQRIVKEGRTGTVTFVPIAIPGQESAPTEVE